MKNRKFKIGAIVFALGTLGSLSMLAFDLTSIKFVADNLPEDISREQLKLLSLLNPMLMVLGFTVLGTFLYEKVSYRLPIIESFVDGESNVDWQGILKGGIIGGLVAGIGIVAAMALATPILPPAFFEAMEDFNPPFIMKMLYGGITEEILMRFGFQTLITWLLFKLTKKLNLSIIIAIAIASVAFGLGHLPVLNLLVPNPTMALTIFIVFANSIGGIVFGYLYWKRGLESAMIAHIITHVVMTIGSLF